MITQVAIDTITFNDNKYYGIYGTPGLEMPPIRTASYNLPGQHGGKFVSSFYGKRRFSLQGIIIGDTTSDFLTKFDAFRSVIDIISGGEPIVFTRADGKIMQITAKLLQLDAPYKPGVTVAVDFNAAFEAAYPYLVSQTETIQTINLATGGGGTVPPPTMPMALNANTGGSIFVVNNGNAPYAPTARINGPVTNPSLRNATLGIDLLFSLTLLSGEYIDVNFKNFTIFDNTGRNRYDSKNGDWWTLLPGTSEVRFIADSTDPAAQATFRSRDAWLGM